MKKLMALFFLMMTGLLYTKSQSDTIIVSEEQVNRSGELNDCIYKLFVVDRDSEIKHLWKFDLVSFSFVKPNIGFEQQIGERWSSNTFLRGGFYIHAGGFSSYYSLNPIWTHDYEMEITQQLRYYHNFKRRERLGKITNGFSGNFFALSLSSSYKRMVYGYLDPDFTVSEIGYSLNYSTSVGVYYGLQRRIGNIGFIEGYAGIAVNKHNIVDGGGYQSESLSRQLIVGIRVGFAITSFKNLRRMLCR